MAALRSVFGLVLSLLILSTVAGDELCRMCDCKRSASEVGQMQSIICQKPNRKLFEDDVEWPKNVQRIELIEFKDILSAVLPMCVKYVFLIECVELIAKLCHSF